MVSQEIIDLKEDKSRLSWWKGHAIRKIKLRSIHNGRNQQKFESIKGRKWETYESNVNGMLRKNLVDNWR